MAFNAIYHVAALNHWRHVIREQLPILLGNRTLRQAVVTVGTNDHIEPHSLNQEISNVITKITNIVPFEVRICRLHDFEHPAMVVVDEMARRSSLPILYFHSKAVSYAPPRARFEKWRKYLNGFVAEGDKWADFLMWHYDYDACGPLQLSARPHGFGFFAGNFWMATSAYLKSLPPYLEFIQDPRCTDFIPGDRYLAEVAVNRTRRMRSYCTDSEALNDERLDQFFDLLEQSDVPIVHGSRCNDTRVTALLGEPRSVSDIVPSHSKGLGPNPVSSSVVDADFKQRRRVHSVAAHLQTCIPIFIPVFNNPTYLTQMLSQLRLLGFENIIIVDNNSTFPPMLNCLSTLESDLTVIRLDNNRGPRDIFLQPKNLLTLPQYFCVTDPDLMLSSSLPEDFVAELILLTELHRVGKAGFALDLADRNLMRTDKYQFGSRIYQIWEWEAQFWEHPIGQTSTDDTVYNASIDTTFALYNKRYFTPTDHLRAIRVAGRYTCRHLPWYRHVILPDDEAEVYWNTQKYSFFPVTEESGGPSR